MPVSSPLTPKSVLRLFLSRILETNFQSDSGQLFPFRVAMIIIFGGHLTMKKGTIALLTTKKRSTFPPVFILIQMHKKACVV